MAMHSLYKKGNTIVYTSSSKTTDRLKKVGFKYHMDVWGKNIEYRDCSGKIDFFSGKDFESYGILDSLELIKNTPSRNLPLLLNIKDVGFNWDIVKNNLEKRIKKVRTKS